MYEIGGTGDMIVPPPRRNKMDLGTFSDQEEKPPTSL